MPILTHEDAIRELKNASPTGGYGAGAENTYNIRVAPLLEQAQQNGFINDPNFQSTLSQLVRSIGNSDATGRDTYTTQLNNMLQQQNQLNQQNKQLTDFNKSYQTQMFGADASGNPFNMQQALAGNTGSLGSLNQFETQQTADTFNKLLSPQITMALGGQGLQNSGAQVELQSKALSQLQMAQQQNIMQAALGAQSQSQGLQQQQVLGNIAGQQSMVGNTMNTNNALLTMQFQQQLMQQQAQLAQQLASFGGGGSGGLMGGLSGALGGGLAGFAVGGPVGAGIGALGGGFAGGYSQQGFGQGIGGLGSAFFAAAPPKNYSSYRQY